MRVVAQRVARAAVEVGGRSVGEIGRGLLLLVGIEKGDGEKEIAFMADKVLNLRIFPDDQDKMNLSVRDIRGGVLSVSQFTLAARNKRGRRPDFTHAEEPGKAEALYERFNSLLAAAVPVATGVFGAMMDVASVNSGPVTIILEKSKDELD
ncbi:MAG: D-aminoacyl-tRNA deacylase [Acidobacteria bacterium]|jgi:D-tyrosyl-tRNA(Tyr) deacylase|nr:D-aminoacyl-tRNA deacylase [Acidobacteriota bacterium]